MRVKSLLAVLAIMVACLYASSAIACTGIQLKAKDGGVVVGRTLEFGIDVRSDIAVVPAGTHITNHLADTSKGLSYKSKYGMVGATFLGINILIDGVNEKGLYAGAFYFPGYSTYPDLNPKNYSRALAPQDYATWILANFASVEEVKANFDKVVLVNSPSKAFGGKTLPGHLVVRDRTGASVVIEPVDKTLKLHDNPLGVITNAPTFDWHITNLRNYINLTATNVPPVKLDKITLAQFGEGSGMRGIPGDFTPPSRFVRAVAFSQFAPQLPTTQETVFQVLHLMNAFDIPLGAVRAVEDKKVNCDYTVWTTTTDLKNVRWYFRTYNDQSIRCVDLRKALSKAGGKPQIIKMDSKQKVKDVSTDFEKK